MKIGNYQLIRQLSQGGMAQVWLARREWNDGKRKIVVIKIPRTSAMVDVRKMKMFEDEAGLAMLLDHPNIVPTFDKGVHEGLPWIAMSYVPGCNVALLVKEVGEGGSEFDFDVAAHVTRELGYGLQFAHEYEIDEVLQNVIHRDVSSKNVLVSGAGAVMLADFGVASAASVESTGTHVKGTFRFMAPEHALGQATVKSDAFGMGTVLWELLEGKPFRYDVAPADLVSAALDGHITPLSRSGVPANLLRAVNGLLAPNERERITVGEAIELLGKSDQRGVLKKMVARYFGGEARRSGHSSVSFVPSDELNNAIKFVEFNRGLQSPIGPVADVEIRESDVRGLPKTADEPVPAALRSEPELGTAAGPSGRAERTAIQPGSQHARAGGRALPATEQLPRRPQGSTVKTAVPRTQARGETVPTVFGGRNVSLAEKSGSRDSGRAAQAEVGEAEPAVPPSAAVPASPTRSSLDPSDVATVEPPPQLARVTRSGGSSKRRWLAGAMVLIGATLLSALATGLWLLSDSERSDNSEGVAKTVKTAPPPAPAVVGQPGVYDYEPHDLEIPDDPPAKQSALADAEAPTMPAPAPSPEPSPSLAAPADSETQPKSAKKPPPARPRVPVRIVLGFVQGDARVKLAGRSYTLTREGDIKARIPIGTHTLRWKLDSSTMWASQRFVAKADHDHFIEIGGSGMTSSASKMRAPR